MLQRIRTAARSAKIAASAILARSRKIEVAQVQLAQD
jgi:hypothetical protein